eukprot:CAMPEP_0195509952 /NCGR_PEP_ID=MMETSP0794_2-20130614/2741_1 /TAXON_ID=515487 /ORGANISM="Stephanopyxis turris, Strain CCMP 815" /LENGTH=102 /DNA_ID=CAMNT_0040637293 /DNA_START=245 /DNA_END=553 /DNA_ORIENTATION=-
MVSWPISCIGEGDDMNMTLLGDASSWVATIFTAVRSSMESPKEMTSLRPKLVFSRDESVLVSSLLHAETKEEFNESLDLVLPRLFWEPVLSGLSCGMESFNA